MNAPIAPRSPRVAAIDILRGFVMVLMAIDHASHNFNGGALFTDSVFFFKPGTPLPEAQFFTRWITHLCAPTFVALAGTALAISTSVRRSKGESESSIDRHIFIRGALLIGFEIVWMSWAMREPGKFLFQVLYALGGSLICMSLLRRLSDRVLLGVGLVLAFGSEPALLLAKGSGSLGELPLALTATGGFFFGQRLIVAYPLLPWLSMMCLGWVFGRRLVAWRASGKDETLAASRVLAVVAVVALGVFVVFRAVDGYGNMGLLRDGPGVVQWLHVSKYPPSATYIGLELGIASLLLAGLMRIGPAMARVLEPLRLLGQTALFFYLLHIHVLWLVTNVANLHHKFGIGSAYAGGVAVIIALYPACAWYRRYKAAHPMGWARWI